VSRFERKSLRQQARQHALVSARARGCRCRPRVEWDGPAHIYLVHQDGCPLIDTLPALPGGGHGAWSLIFPGEEVEQ
jgi:hypothetical protein